VEYLKQHFYREGRLEESQALYILEKATNICSREANMVEIKSPVTSPLFFTSCLFCYVLTTDSLWRYPWSICECFRRRL